MNGTRWGRLLVWLLRGLALLLLLLLAYRVYGYFELKKSLARFEKEVPSLETASYAPPHIVDTENAALPLLGGAYAMRINNADERGFLRGLTEKPYAAMDEATRARAEALVARNEAAYQVMALAIPLEQSSFELKYNMGWDMPIPNYLRILQAKHVIGTRVRLQVMKKDPEGAMQAMAVLERLAASLQHEPVLISCLIGHASQKSYDLLVQEMLSTSDAAALQTLEGQLKHLRSMAVPVDRVFGAEAVAVYSKLRAQYPVGEGNQIAQDVVPRGFYWINRPHFLAELLNYYSDMIALSRSPLSGHPKDEAPAGWARRLVCSAIESPQLYEAVARFQATNSELLLADLAVKVTLAAKQNGAYPRDLSAFKTEPSPYAGETVKYMVNPDGSATLSYPEADRLWDQSMKDAVPAKPLFVWKLPPPNPD